jgi:catechol 2,3-dioxygenase
VYLLVPDLQRSISYYEQVIGLQLRDRTADTAVLGTQDTPLVTLRTERDIRPARKGAFGLYHFAILLPDRPALGRFAAHISRAGVRAGMADHLVSEALYLNDPDGLGIEVYADRPQSSWQYSNGELVMAVDPLDTGLIAAGGGLPWEEAPAGTTIGHVHLHVGSIEAAQTFYHAGVGFTKTVWTYPGALFLAAGGYHHHLAVNTWAPGPSASETEARLLEWELVVPDTKSMLDVAGSLRQAGYVADETAEGVKASDPWGTGLRITASA